jgi:diacylglycerol kinase family enzyme
MWQRSEGERTAGREDRQAPTALYQRRPRCALLLNAAAGRNASSPEERLALRELFSPLGEIAEVASPDALAALFRGWRAAGVELLVLSGGDGTIHRALAALKETWGGAPFPALAVLHGGTLGVVAQELGGGAALAAAAALRSALLEGGDALTTRWLPTLAVGGRLCFNFGLGVFASLPAEFARRRGERLAVGRLAARAVASALFGGALARRVLAPWPGEVSAAAAKLAGPLVGLYASGLRSMWRFRGFSRLPRPEGSFGVLAVRGGRVELLRKLLPFLRGEHRDLAPAAELFATHQLSLFPRGSFLYMADGELYLHEGPLALKPGPSVRFLVPSRKG